MILYRNHMVKTTGEELWQTKWRKTPKGRTMCITARHKRSTNSHIFSMLCIEEKVNLFSFETDDLWKGIRFYSHDLNSLLVKCDHLIDGH